MTQAKKDSMHINIIANGMINLLVRRFLGPFWMRRRWLEKTQWLSAQALQQIQLDLLKKMVRHCYDTVPYYRQLMDKRGITVNSINTLDDIKRFPILTKNDVLQAGDAIISTKYPKWMLRRSNTGGTTGTPMVIYRNLFSIGNEHAFVRRQWDWAGIGFGDKCAYLKGRITARPGSKRSHLYLYDPIMKELHLSTYHLSTETAKDYIQLMKKYRVKALVGYPSSVYPVARACLEEGIELKLQTVLTTSETLVKSQRKAIAKAFHCKVFDFLGAAERVCYIHTCDHGGYHLIPEYGLTELISVGNSTDGRCKIIASGFWNMAMPLIRYDTGDLLVKSDELCPCGRAFPLVKSVFGREGDVIKTPSGRELGASIITHLVYVICGASNIIESQVIQDAIDHITIEYVPCKGFSKESFVDFQKRLAQHFGGDLRVDLKQVDAVRKTESGRLRPVISQIASQDCHLEGQLQ